MTTRGPNTDLRGFRILRMALFSRLCALFSRDRGCGQRLQQEADSSCWRVTAGGRGDIFRQAGVRRGQIREQGFVSWEGLTMPLKTPAIRVDSVLARERSAQPGAARDVKP